MRFILLPGPCSDGYAAELSAKILAGIPQYCHHAVGSQEQDPRVLKDPDPLNGSAAYTAPTRALPCLSKMGPFSWSVMGHPRRE